MTSNFLFMRPFLGNDFESWFYCWCQQREVSSDVIWRGSVLFLSITMELCRPTSARFASLYQIIHPNTNTAQFLSRYRSSLGLILVFINRLYFNPCVNRHENCSYFYLTLRRPTCQSWHIKVIFNSHGSAWTAISKRWKNIPFIFTVRILWKDCQYHMIIVGVIIIFWKVFRKI